jgi:DNA segregation ATPase FtsK/SpoIIIE, S-DNA-T family
MGRKKGRRRSPYKLKLKKETLYSLASLVLIVAGLLVIISFAGQGRILRQVQDYFQEQFGFATLLIPFMLISGGLMLTQTKLRFTKPNVFLGAVLLFLMVLGLGKAGAVGTELFGNLANLIQPAGATILLVGIGAAGFLIMTESSLDDLFVRFMALFQQAGTARDSLAKIKLPGKDQGFSIEERGIKIKGGRSVLNEGNDTKAKQAKGKGDGKEDKDKDDKPMGLSTAVVANVPGSSEGIYTPPPLSLLHDTIGGEADRGDIKQNASVIERTLESFGIQARVVEVNLGPAVTQYALEIALGTKLSRITGLQNDLALALAAPTGQIRIEAPIPGRSMVGVEIPNRSPEMVTLKSMLTSKQMKQNKSKTAVGLGLNVSGEAVVADISKMPHILIAGATGSGKSVSVNAFLLQMLFRASPEEVKFILVDPKRVELTGYNGIPHLLTPVIVDPEKVVAALEWAINEMEKRYKLFAEVGARNIKTYNEMTGFQSLPYLIIVIDELADIMLFAPNQVEDAITRLAQMARATGIHLILATQRPSVDVLTGLIKANIPSRIAFNVTTMVDSRVIIDTPGAEKLLGKGDMLYIPPEQAKPSRIQGTFVSDEEAKEVIDFIKQSGTAPTYAEEVTTKFAPKKISGPNGTMDDVDDMFEVAVREVTANDKASASLLQRRLSIGYARAARILDQLEQAGIVGPQDGSKPREVLIQNADSYFNHQDND